MRKLKGQRVRSIKTKDQGSKKGPFSESVTFWIIGPFLEQKTITPTEYFIKMT